MKLVSSTLIATFAALCGIVGAGCGGGSSIGQTGSNEGSPTPSPTPTATPVPTPTPLAMSQFRLLYSSPNAGNVDAFVDGNPMLTNVPYKAVSTYLSIGAGSHTFKLNQTGTSNTIISSDINLAANVDYTIASAGDSGSIVPLVLTDDNSAPSSGNGKVRFVHLAPSAGAVDVYVTGQDTDITAAAPTVSSVNFKASTSYLMLSAGTYRLRVTPAGTKDVVIDGNFTLAAGQIRTAVAVGDPNAGQPLEAIVLADR